MDHDSAIIIARAAAEMRVNAERAANNAAGDTLCCWESERIGGHERVTQVRNYPDGTDGGVIAVPTEAGVAAHIAGFHPNTGLAIAKWLDELSLTMLARKVVDEAAADSALTIARAYLTDQCGTTGQSGGAAAMTEPQQASAGEMRPEDVPDELVNAAFKATGYRLRGPDLRNIAAAMMTQLGLREEWGVRWPDEEITTCANEDDARGRAPLEAGAKPIRRYVTDWEDADA